MSLLPSEPSTLQAAPSNACDVSLSLVPSSLLNEAKCAHVTSVPGGPVSRLAVPDEVGNDGPLLPPPGVVAMLVTCPGVVEPPAAGDLPPLPPRVRTSTMATAAARSSPPPTRIGVRRLLPRGGAGRGSTGGSGPEGVGPGHWPRGAGVVPGGGAVHCGPGAVGAGGAGKRCSVGA